MRDFIEAINSRVVVYDGGMGATLEQFDLDPEDYGGLPGKCHEALVLNRPDVIEGVHASMLVAGSIGPTGYLPASEDPSLGQIRFGELVDVFSEQARGLIEGGVDLLIIETAQDLLEVKAAVFGARAAFAATGRRLPIHTSVSLLPNGGKM